MRKENFNKILLMALSEPEYARVDFWIAEQKDSKYSKKVFLKKLMDSYQHYEYQIDKKEAEARAYNPDAEITWRLPLFYETDHELIGHVGRSELHSLLLSIKKLLNKWYPDNDESDNQAKQIQPIHWLKGEKSLRQFIDSLNSAGLIDSRETDDIIQEHFRQTDQTPQPIQWSKSNRLLIYLFNKLTEAGLIDTMDRQFQLISEHFLSKKGQPLKADNLKSDSYNMKTFFTSEPKGSETIDRIIQELTD